MSTNNACDIINVVSGLALAGQRISTQTASTSPTIDFTGLTNTYASYLVVMNRVAPDTNNASFKMLTGNGGTYSTSSYTNLLNLVKTSGQTSYINSDGAGSAVEISATQGVSSSSTDHAVCGLIQLYSVANNSAPAVIQLNAFGLTNGGDRWLAQGGCRGDSSGATDCIQFKFSSGNIASGTFTLYGLLF